MDFTVCYRDTVSSVALAARTRDPWLVRTLIQRSLLSVYNRDNRGWNALHEAAASGATECARLLLSATSTVCDGGCYGKTLDYVASETHQGESALYLAAQAGHLAVVRLLLRAGANLNQPTNDGSCPLYTAVDGGHEEVVQLLVRKGADLNKAHTHSRWTCLHQAVFKGYRKIVHILAEKCILEVYDENHITPLFVAAQCGQQECLTVLIRAGADVNVQASDFATPLMIASQHGHEGCVDVLLAHGADPNLACSHTWTQLPIHSAAQFGHIGILAKLIAVTDRVCDRGESSVSPLYMALMKEHSHIVEFLLKEGFSPDAQIGEDTFGWESPLSYALGLREDRSVSECARLLLSAGAGLNREVWIYTLSSDNPEQLQEVIQQRRISRPEQRSKSINISGADQKSSMFTREELCEMVFVAEGDGLQNASTWLPVLLQAGLEPSLFLNPTWLKKVEPEVLSYFLEFLNWSTLPRLLLNILDQRQLENTWTPRSHQVSLPPLSHLCRLQVREVLGSEVVMQAAAVQQLPLPLLIQTYLQFTDILPPSKE